MEQDALAKNTRVEIVMRKTIWIEVGDGEQKILTK